MCSFKTGGQVSCNLLEQTDRYTNGPSAVTLALHARRGLITGKTGSKLQSIAHWLCFNSYGFRMPITMYWGTLFGCSAGVFCNRQHACLPRLVMLMTARAIIQSSIVPNHPATLELCINWHCRSKLKIRIKYCDYRDGKETRQGWPSVCGAVVEWMMVTSSNWHCLLV